MLLKSISRILLCLPILWTLISCTAPQQPRIETAQPHPAKDRIAVECPVTYLPLAPPLIDRSLEISGAAWYGDMLILLPQYPERFDGQLFGLSKRAILDSLEGQVSDPLDSIAIPFDDGDLRRSIRGFEGFEAIAFDEEVVYLTIEASPGFSMLGHLVSGIIEPDLSQIQLDPNSVVPIESQTEINNKSDESLFLVDGRPVTLHEANGANVNPAPIAHRFDPNLQLEAELPMPHIEYRITDATALDENSRFWAINYFYPGDQGRLEPVVDPLVEHYGAGPTHAQWEPVERLVEFQYTSDAITLVDRPPLQLALLPDNEARNWEGVVRLPEMDGFLVVTDKFPETVLGFVPTCN